jgi:hypothetical protein
LEGPGGGGEKKRDEGLAVVGVDGTPKNPVDCAGSDDCVGVKMKEEHGFAEEEPKGLMVVDALAQTRHEAVAAAAAPMGWKQRLHRLSMSART